MPNTLNLIKPEQIVEIVLRRRWFVIIPLCLSLIAGIYASLTLPKTYESETLILVEPPRVPGNYVQALVSSDVDARIRTIRQQVMSRTNLEKIIREYQLFSEPEYEKMYMEDKLEILSKRISLNVIRAGRGPDAFSIAYTGKDPEKTMKIANSMATFFIDESLKIREAQAIGTSNFLDDELNDKRKRLEETEDAIKTYHQRYMGELPGELETNLNILNRLQEQLIAKQEALKSAKDSLRILEKQISETKNMLQYNTSMFSTGDSVEFEGEDPAGLNQLKEQLAVLKTRYKDQHPDVARIKRLIAEEEEKIRKEEEAAQGTPSEILESQVALPEINYQDIQAAQLMEIRNEIKNAERDVVKILNKISIYEKRVENTPKREQELLSLNRDYENLKSMYDSLLKRRLEAEISVNMEKKQKGEQFRIIDPARLPVKPLSPNAKKLFALSLAAGLGIGAGLIFMLEYFSSCFRKTEDIESYLGLPVLAIVPAIDNPRDKKRQRINNFLSIFSIMFCFILIAGFATLALKGTDKIIELVGRFISI